MLIDLIKCWWGLLTIHLLRIKNQLDWLFSFR